MQQQKLSCTNCGAELMPEGKFCRRCGQPTSHLNRGSVTEVTTRRLETPGQTFGQNPFAAQANLAPSSRGQTTPALNAQTQAVAPKRSSRWWIPVLVLLALFILLPIPTFLIVRHWKHSTVRVPAAPSAPTVPQPPKPVLPPPPSQGETGTPNIDNRYVYPGSRTTMIISKAGEGDKVQLTTKDDVDKVAEWYINELKPTERVISPKNVVLKTDKISVIITSNGDGSNILLKAEP